MTVCELAMLADTAAPLGWILRGAIVHDADTFEVVYQTGWGDDLEFWSVRIDCEPSVAPEVALREAIAKVPMMAARRRAIEERAIGREVATA